MPESLVTKKERVVGIVKAYGPLLPVTLAKKLDLNITFASAILSELVDNKTLMITSVKSGGSPFYYIQGQENKLQDLMKYLNGKDKDTAELLKKEKVLRDRDLDNLKRFGLRQIKDFAKPVNVTVNNQTDLFWRWYLANDDEVKNLINEYLEAHLPKPAAVEKQEIQVSKEVQDVGEIGKLKEEQIKLGQIYEQESKREIKPEVKTETKIEAAKLKEIKAETVKPKEEREKIKEVKVKAKEAKTKEEIKVKKADYDLLGKFFMDNKVDILDEKIIKKNKEVNYITGVSTDLGKGVFFLKYKNKNKINEADLSLAMHEAGNMPLIFLSTGELTKKARELLGTEFKGVIFKKI